MEPVFHIGYHKTASSWLQQVYFAEHPDIALLSNSAKPWNDRFLSYLIATPDTTYDPGVAIELFQERLHSMGTGSGSRKVLMISAERLSGHPFSGGYDSFSIARRIAAAFSHARIVCVVRNPENALISVYKQMVVEGYPGTLEKLISQQRWKTARFSLDYFDYDRLIEKYFELFGIERVCVLRYELLRKNAAEFLRQLCAFLGVDFVESIKTSKRVYPSLPNASVGFLRRLNYFHESELYPFPVFELGGAYSPLRRLAIKFAGNRSHRSGRAQYKLPDEIVQRFATTSERLAHLLEHDRELM